MKVLLVTILMLFVSTFYGSTPTDNSNDILGSWLMANKNVKVLIYQSNEKYHGKVVWMDCDANTKNFKLGNTIIDEMEYNSEKARYEGGSFYGRGYRLNCALSLITKDLMEVVVSKGFLQQVRYCTRWNGEEIEGL